MTTLADRFELIAEAARGGMGSVHRGRDLRTGQLVAVKILDITPQFDRTRFKREAMLLASIRHPNIVRYVAHGATPDGVHYLVQEWVDGITLSTQLATIGVSEHDAVQVAIGVGEALGTVHHHGIVHRDVKPANVILDAGDPTRIKLVDFGIARLEADAGILTRVGTLVGTPSYMSPEQARGSIEISPAADVWALGCVLYEALTGRRAFGGRKPEAIRAKVLLHHPPPVDELCPELDPHLARVIDVALHKQASERFATGTELAEALRKTVHALKKHPPRRAVQHNERTKASPRPSPKPSMPAKCYALVSIAQPEPGAMTTHPRENIQRISARRGVRVHELDDGSLILEAERPGKDGALDTAYVALEIHAQLEDGAVSVFAQPSDESIADAIDRGADRLSQATVATMFAAALDAEPLIPIDDVAAELLASADVTVVTTDAGQALRARTGTAS